MPLPLRTTYTVCVFRATQREVRAFYRLPLREPLPAVAIPLRPGDRDVALDLQAVINQAYEEGLPASAPPAADARRRRLGCRRAAPGGEDVMQEEDARH